MSFRAFNQPLETPASPQVSRPRAKFAACSECIAIRRIGVIGSPSPVMPLALAPAARYFATDHGRSQLVGRDVRPLIKLGRSLRVLPGSIVTQRRSAKPLSWTFALYSTSGATRSTHRRHSESATFRLQGLITLVTVSSLACPRRTLFQTGSAHEIRREALPATAAVASPRGRARMPIHVRAPRWPQGPTPRQRTRRLPDSSAAAGLRQSPPSD